MKKLVLRLDLHDDKSKQKAFRTVSTLSGINSISMDMKERKLTVIGTVDPIDVVRKLRKYWPGADIISVGPAVEPKKEEPKKEEPKKEEAKKEEPKKEEPKKEEPKKEEPKKEGGGREGQKKEAEEKKKEQLPPPPQLQPQPDPVLELVKAYRAYNPHLTSYYYVHSMEENPNACVIC